MSDSQASRLVLARDLLGGNLEAALVLADLLEEEGDRSSAAWARAKKRSRYKRMDFVIGVLPVLTALQAACDFMAYSLDLHIDFPVTYYNYPHGTRTSNNARLRPLLTAVRNVSGWAAGEQRDISRECAAIAGVSPSADISLRELDLLMQALHVAILSAQVVEQRRAGGEPCLREASASRDASRRVARGARQLAKPVTASITWRQNRQQALLEVDVDVHAWQHAHLEKLLDAAIEDD